MNLRSGRYPMKKALVCLAALAVVLSARGNPIGVFCVDSDYLSCFSIGYGIAVLLEVLATCLVRRKNWIIAVALVNCITYPLFLLFLLTVPRLYVKSLDLFHYCYVPLAEIAIVLIEFFLLSLIYRFKDCKHLFVCSLIMNAFSYGVSILILFLIHGIP